jgi:GTP:adenosylcobinamide-phosphate guanylyltransferase
VSATDRRFTALILAGSRGPDDPVARQAGQTHKALVPVAGVPMLLRVLRTLREAPSIGRLALCIDRPALEQLRDPVAAGLLSDVRIVEPGPTPSASVRRAIEELPDALPLLVTTADHALLTTAMVEHFCAAAPADADVAVALATATTIQRDYPESIRTYYRFGGEGYSGCNLFLLRGPAATKVAAFWSEMERHRKRPWRLVAAIGPLTLLRFLLGALSLEAAMRRLSRIIGATVCAVEMPFAEAAIDIDKPADLALAERILMQRGR